MIVRMRMPDIMRLGRLRRNPAEPPRRWTGAEYCLTAWFPPGAEAAAGPAPRLPAGPASTIVRRCLND